MDLLERTKYVSLDDYYKFFSFGSGPNVKNSHRVLEVTGPDESIIWKWRDFSELIMIFLSL